MRWHHWGLGGGAVLVVGVWVLDGVIPPAAPVKFLFTVGGILAFQSGTAAVAEAQRARMVWLVNGSREEIFDLCERVALVRCGGWALATVMAGALAWGLGLVGLAGAVWGVAFVVSLACACSYAGLLWVAGHPARVVLVVVMVVSWVTGPVLAAGALRVPAGQTTVWPTLPVVALLIEALVARTIARRRWQRIDWLRQRPIRWLTSRPHASHGG